VKEIILGRYRSWVWLADIAGKELMQEMMIGLIAE